MFRNYHIFVCRRLPKSCEKPSRPLRLMKMPTWPSFTDSAEISAQDMTWKSWPVLTKIRYTTFATIGEIPKGFKIIFLICVTFLEIICCSWVRVQKRECRNLLKYNNTYFVGQVRLGRCPNQWGLVRQGMRGDLSKLTALNKLISM